MNGDGDVNVVVNATVVVDVDVDVVVDVDVDVDVVVDVDVDVVVAGQPTTIKRSTKHALKPRTYHPPTSARPPSMTLSFQKLDVYQRAIEFVALTAQISNDIPRGHAALLDQLRRAASSIPLNIAEAAGRTGKADVSRVYAIARGSAMECAAALDAMRLLKAVDEEVYRRGCGLLERVVAMLTKMCR